MQRALEDGKKRPPLGSRSHRSRQARGGSRAEQSRALWAYAPIRLFPTLPLDLSLVEGVHFRGLPGGHGHGIGHGCEVLLHEGGSGLMHVGALRLGCQGRRLGPVLGREDGLRLPREDGLVPGDPGGHERWGRRELAWSNDVGSCWEGVSVL